jgi:hypothetical protein
MLGYTDLVREDLEAARLSAAFVRRQGHVDDTGLHR